jgi:SnoaL-like domain
MVISLPLPIETYVRAENSGDVDTMSDCFAPYATIRDERRYVEGLPAIKAWRARMKQRHNHTVTPIEVNTSDGQVTLKAELRGTFPGSPVTVNFHFALVNDQIASLQIRNQPTLELCA